MNNTEIQEKLSGYRPESYRDDDPEIAQALALAKANPELWASLEEGMEFDRHLSRALKSVPVDEDAKAQLLALNTKCGGSQSFVSKKLVVLALSAAAVLICSAFLVKYFCFPPPVEFPRVANAGVTDFRDHMAYFATQRFTLEKSTPDLEESRTWLAERGSPVYKATPELIARLEGMGCRVIDWNGTQVSLICFLNGDEDLVHLFIVDTAKLTGEQMAGLGRMDRYHHLETQGWSDSKNVYLLVGSKPKVSLSGLLH